MYNTQPNRPPEEPAHPSAPPAPAQPASAPSLLTNRAVQRKWMPWLIVGGLLAAGLLIFLGVTGTLLAVYLSQPRIPTGVSVAGIELGGETIENTQEILEDELQVGTIRFTDGDRNWTRLASDIGVSIDVERTLEEAENARPNTDVQPYYTIDFTQAQEGFIALSEEVNIDPIAGDDPQPGRVLDIPFALDRLRADLNGELRDGIFDLNMIEVEPEDPEEAEISYDGETTTHVVARGQELGLIARQYGVTIDAILELNEINNPDLIFEGQELVIPAAGVYQPSQEEAPAPPTITGKSIVVSTETQRIYAYENGELIRSHLTSTGLPETPTVKGDYAIYVKFEADDMRGPDYFLPQVPWTMYFYQGYGIHGTYWHNSFGRPMSHGCVNLPVDEAKWWFDWAETGTPVRVV